jgi:hypothetical protein
MLWYHTRADDHPDVRQNPPIWRPTIDDFLAADLLRLAPKEEQQLRQTTYVTTMRGDAYCEALMRVPRPEVHYVIRWPAEHVVADVQRDR